MVQYLGRIRRSLNHFFFFFFHGFQFGPGPKERKLAASRNEQMLTATNRKAPIRVLARVQILTSSCQFFFIKKNPRLGSTISVLSLLANVFLFRQLDHSKSICKRVSEPWQTQLGFLEFSAEPVRFYHSPID